MRTHTHLSVRQHPSNPALLFLMRSNSPRDKCLSKTLSKQQEIFGKNTPLFPKPPLPQIFLYHCSSINLVVNSLFIYGTLKRRIWIIRGVTKGELCENNKMTTTPKPPEGTCQHIASVSSSLDLSPWARYSAGSHADTNTSTPRSTHISS